MEITASEQGGIGLLEPVGSIDTRGAVDFERKVVELLGGGTRLFAIDFSRVDLITSAGIRVLVMLAKRLHASGGRLVLCGLNDQVAMVFEIAGLAKQFDIASSQQEAVAQLSRPAAPASAAPLSRVSRLITRLLGGEAAVPPRRARPAGSGTGEGGSELSARVAELLTETPDRASRSSSTSRPGAPTPAGPDRT